jgi:hypothetical protein
MQRPNSNPAVGIIMARLRCSIHRIADRAAIMENGEKVADVPKS